jgi:precorrin-6A/cobalt-precorrin-6A reductase
VPLLRLARRGWANDPRAARWHWAADHDDAATIAAGLGTVVLLTTGRQNLHRFTTPLVAHRVFARVVDPVDHALPPRWTVLLERGPYELDGERRLMVRCGVEVLVTKDSGGEHTRAKLVAADQLGVEVVVVRRPEPQHGVESVSDVAEALRWLHLLTT